MKRIAFTTVALAIAASAWAYAGVRPPSTLDRIRRKGVVRAGIAFEPPWVYRLPNGRVAGEAPEVLQAAMHALGVDSIEWVPTRFGSLLLELDAGTFDVIAAGLYRTDERAARVLFTRPTITVATVMLVRGPDSARTPTLEALAARTDGRVAVLAGAVEGTLAADAGLDSTRRLEVPDILTGVAALDAGEVDALLLSAPSILAIQRARPGEAAALAVVPLDTTRRPGLVGHPAFAFRRTDRSLRNAVDDVLGHYLGSPAHRRLLTGLGLDATIASSGADP